MRQGMPMERHAAGKAAARWMAYAVALAGERIRIGGRVVLLGGEEEDADGAPEPSGSSSALSFGGA